MNTECIFIPHVHHTQTLAATLLNALGNNTGYMFAPWQSLLLNTSYVLFYQTSRTTLAPTHPIHQVPRFLSSAVNQPGLEDDHSPPFSANVKNEWSYTSTSHLHALKVCILMIMLRILVNLHCIPLAVLLQPSQFFCTVQVIYFMCFDRMRAFCFFV